MFKNMKVRIRMRVKAIQIARELGVSKATVSLALNNKPGVSEQTRKEIFECKARLESETGSSFKYSRKRDGKIIKVLVALKGMKVAFSSEMDLWTDVLEIFEKEIRKGGYEIDIDYVNVCKDSIEDSIQECDGGDVAGVILQATELDDDDIAKFEKIKIPMVIYDNESTDSRHNCVVADNYLGVNRAVKYLVQKGYKDIIYLANTKEIYNFRKRREGFCTAFLECNLNPYQPSRIVPIGATIENVYIKMKQYLETHELPEAFVMENYQVTIGVMRALRERQIQVPGKVALIGVDLLPAYMTGDCQITAVRIPHTERAVLTMMLLNKEIEEQSVTKSRIMTDCRLVEGESV